MSKKRDELIEEYKKSINYIETPTSCSWCRHCKEVELDATLCCASEDEKEWFEVQLYASCDFFGLDPLMCEGSPLEQELKGVKMDDIRAINAIEQELKGIFLDFKFIKIPTQRDVDSIRHQMNTVLLSAQDSGRVLLGNSIHVGVSLEDGKIKIEYPKWIKEKRFA